MLENMRYAHFCKICEICCDRMIAINRYPYNAINDEKQQTYIALHYTELSGVFLPDIQHMHQL